MQRRIRKTGEWIFLFNIIHACVLFRITDAHTESPLQIISTHSRVKPDSKVPISALTNKEAQERYGNLKKLYKDVLIKLKRFEAKEAKEKEAKENTKPAPKSQTVAGNEEHLFPTPLLPWPFYLNYNPTLAQEYSLPANSSLSGPVAVGISKPKAKRTPKSARKKPAKDSTDGFAKLVTKKSTSAISKQKETQHEEENAGDIAMEEIADEPLDHASVELCQDEEAVTSKVIDGDNHNASDEKVESSELDEHLV